MSQRCFLYAGTRASAGIWNHRRHLPVPCHDFTAIPFCRSWPRRTMDFSLPDVVPNEDEFNPAQTPPVAQGALTLAPNAMRTIHVFHPAGHKAKSVCYYLLQRLSRGMVSVVFNEMAVMLIYFRCSIRCGDIRKGVQLSISSPSKLLKKECAEILEGMKVSLHFSLSTHF